MAVSFNIMGVGRGLSPPIPTPPVDAPAYLLLLRDHIKQTVVKQISVFYLNGGREWII